MRSSPSLSLDLCFPALSYLHLDRIASARDLQFKGDDEKLGPLTSKGGQKELLNENDHARMNRARADRSSHTIGGI